MKNLNTIYVAHYFHGEYDIAALLHDSGYKGYAFMYLELDKGTLDTLNDADLLKPNWGDELNKTYGELIINEEPTNIIALHYKLEEAESLATWLRDIAIWVESDAGDSDDSFFDYVPDTVSTIGNLCLLLGFPEMEEELSNLLKTNGHYD